ncbi:acyl-CoA dehydrogenase family protein [Nocardia lijiangensis]|uniref:acyl-CoA dehydrogenase family protein n=1 Tax=Nocardia lijiangensis TaxID=299618 RepID=UPI000AD8754B|nr:acyl-CoA dehydrogenase family protein [Nocardia lijiangensis]
MSDLEALPQPEALLQLEVLLHSADAAAAAWDSRGLPREMVTAAAEAGVLGMDRPTRYGGRGADALATGRMAADLGAVCTSLRSLFTVQGMVAATVDRWGTAEQRASWLPALTGGELVAGLAATEAGAGSDLSGIATWFTGSGPERRVSGRKMWVTFGALADVVLVTGCSEDGPVAALVETGQPGVDVEPVTDQLGMRGARIAHLTFDAARVPAENIIARPGFGLSHVLGTALDHGRYTIAWGCAGMARACLTDAAAHAHDRRQSGVRLADHQAVRAMLGRSWVDVEAAEALCARAARDRIDREPTAQLTTIGAKYAAAAAAAAASERAVQILGAAGCAPGSRAGRFYRDAKIMQIIEGAREVAEQDLGEFVLRSVGESRSAAGR